MPFLRICRAGRGWRRGNWPRGLVRRGHEVTFLAARQNPDSPEDERRDGVRIVRYGGAGQAGAFVRRGREACARLWAETPFDLVHTHFAYAGVGPLRAIPKSVPRVRTFHGPWDEEGWVEDSRDGGWINSVKAQVKRRLRFEVEAANLRGSAKVLTLSDCFRRLVTERYHVVPERVAVIPGGTDTQRFRLPNDKQAVRAALGLPSDRRLLLSVRRLAPRMGLDNLIQAMPSVVVRHPNALLLIGGKGPEEERLAALIQRLHLADHVRLLGFIPDSDLVSYYQAADLFVLPTIALEGFGLVTTEALACGLPVVGTSVGATPEILSGLEPRLIVPGTAPEALARAILGFLEGDWARELTPARLRHFVMEHYQWPQHIDAVEQIYKEVIDKSAHR